MPATLATSRLRWEVPAFQASLGYINRSHLKEEEEGKGKGEHIIMTLTRLLRVSNWGLIKYNLMSTALNRM